MFEYTLHRDRAAELQRQAADYRRARRARSGRAARAARADADDPAGPDDRRRRWTTAA
ncbi:hypothetical protein [Streptomyces sp. B6B3]|uniref:hypothetical protein n=1 Tax=Streptomyces sp. B6B3 TaxID=3153570 RepID=UPI00325F0F33